MNRKIKFRAWDKTAKCMIEPNMYDFVCFDGRIGAAVPHALDGQPTLSSIPSEQYVIMQFTGLLDKDGKEIYEGDVVKILYTDWPSCHGCHKDADEHMNAIALVRIVIWSMQGFYVSHKLDGYAESMEPGKHGFIKVIGNIYQHPHLLKDAV